MLGSADAGQLLMIAALMISSVLNVIYLLSIPVQAFYMSEDTDPDGRAEGAGGALIQWDNLKEAPLLCILPPMITAFGAFALFFFANPLYDYLKPLVGGAG